MLRLLTKRCYGSDCRRALSKSTSVLMPAKPQQRQIEQMQCLQPTIHCRAMTTTAANNSTSTSPPSPPVEQHQKDWHTIYRLPLVRWAAIFNRLKIYQGSFLMLGLPMAMIFEQSGQIPLHTTAVFGAIGGSMVLTLAICSVAMRNLIGFIYINSAGDQVKFAYVDYWGRRRETIVNVDDIKPLSDDDDVVSGKLPIRFDFYKNVGLYSDAKRSYKLINNHGIIVEPDVYDGIFGS